MPNILSPSTWEMSAAQLITPTSSQLAVVNAIQAAVTASANWSVDTTGVSTAGYKYIVIKPSNANSLYADYRIMIVERVNTSTNKVFTSASGDGSAWNSTANVYFRLVPDGGAAHVTFTPANLETANDVYVGTRYRGSLANSQIWATIPVPCTALWLYLCDGAFWIVDRATATSHFLLALGHVMTYTGLSDFNTGGTEVGLAGIRKSGSLSSQSMVNHLNAAQGISVWWGSGTSARTSTGGTAGGIGRVYPQDSSSSNNYYLGRNNTMSFPPIAYWTGDGTNNQTVVFRGLHLGFGQKTRTTIQSNGQTAGYTFYPDDTASGTALATLAFLNT
jgi:hypothetical protein